MTWTAEPPVPPVRSPLAVLLSRFPRVTETFILREVTELERQGQPVVLAPLLREHPPVIHRQAIPWMERAEWIPFLSPAVLAANLRALLRRPGRYLALLARLVAGTALSPGMLVRTLALFPKSVHLAEVLAQRGVTHVHAHFATHPTTAALVVRELAAVPFSFTVHAHDLFVDRALLGWKLRAARFVRTISRFNRDFIAARHPEAAGKLRVVHAGVEQERYGRAGGREPADRRASPGGCRLLCVAALEPYKGIGVLIEALDLLRGRPGEGGPEVRCEVLGEGRERRRLEAEIARRGLGGVVRLTGAVPEEEVARRLAAADAFTLPSVVAPNGQMEGIPVALMEALAAGLPAVASDLSGIPELVEDGVTGLLVPPGDPEALAAALARVAGDPALARRLGEAGRRRVAEGFSLETTVGELLRHLDSERTAGERSGGGTGAAGVATGASDPALPAPVRDLLVEAGLDPGRAAVRRLHRRRDSEVWELEVPGAAGAPREVVAKLQRSRPGESAPAAERARREHALLERLHAASNGNRFGVPRPIGLVVGGDGDDGAGIGALLMARAGGRPLDELIRRRRLGWRPLEPAFAAAGAWLRWLQGVLGTDRRHGDLWPGNLWVAEGGGPGEAAGSAAPEAVPGVQGIDFEGSGPGTPWDDAAYFLVHTETYFRWPVPGWGRRFARLEAAFLAGFLGAPPSEADRADLAAARRGVEQELARRVHTADPAAGKRTESAPEGGR